MAEMNRANKNNANEHGKGVKAFLDGLSYQQMLMISIMYHAYKIKKDNKEFDFKMTSEDPEGGKFDDIGFQFMEDNRWCHIYIQAKHKTNTSQTITWNDLLSTEEKAPYSIRKYFYSFLEQKWDTREEPPMLVLCTNTGLEDEVKKSVSEFVLDEKSTVHSILTSISTVAYEIHHKKLDENIKSDLFSHLKKHLEIDSLANLIAEIIYHEKTLAFRTPLLTKYRWVIEHQIAKEKSKGHDCYKVNEEFFNQNMEFKRVFENKYKLQIVWNDIKKKVRCLGVEEQTKNKASTNCEQQVKIEESDFDALAKLLAKHIYEKNPFDFTNTLLEKYRYIIENSIYLKRQYTKLFFFDKPEYNKFKNIFEKEYKSHIRESFQHIWEDIKHKEIRLKKESDSKEISNTMKTPLPKLVEDNQIVKFLKSFVLICNTNHSKENVIANILKSNLFTSETQNLTASDISYDILSKLILDSMRKEIKSLQNSEIDKMFRWIESSLQFTQLTGRSSLLHRELPLGTPMQAL